MIEWGPIATAGSAGVVLLAAAITVRQRNRADRKDQWWKRTQWAMDLTLSDDEEAQVLGLAVLEQQIGSRLADDEDVKLLEVPILGIALPDRSAGDQDGDDLSEPSPDSAGRDRVRPGVDNADRGDHTVDREEDLP